MQDWDNLRLFLALYRYGSLRAAAEQLGINHSTVSRRLIRLNQEFGVPLFDKSPLGYEVTEAGKSLLDSALNVERTILDSAQSIKLRDQAISGKIKLSLPEAIAEYLILEELMQFQSEHPEIQLEITGSYDFADLNKMEADIVIRGCDTPPEHLIGKRIAKINLCTYSTTDYFDKTDKSKQRWVLANESQKQQSWFLNSGFADIPVGWRIDNFQLRYQALLRGKGICRAPCYIADPNPTIKRLPNAQLTPLFDLWVLTHKDRIEIPRVRLLLEFLYQLLSKHKALLLG